MLEHKLRGLLAGQRRSKFTSGWARGITSPSIKESHQWSCNERWGRQPIGRGRPNSRDVNISFFLGHPQSSGNAKKEGPDVILDNPTVQCMQMSLAGWSDVSAWFIKIMNYVLDHLDFKEQIVRIIPKAENSSKHKNQTDTINNTAKAMRSERSKQYNQRYGRSDAIKAIWPVI